MMDNKFLKEFYKGKKVFLTGHTGFKGSWMLYWLNELGAIIKGYSLAPEDDSGLYNLIKGDELCDSIISDIRQKETLEKSIHDFQPDYIFHLAAQPIVRLSYSKPLETFGVNTMGTTNLLESIRTLNKNCFIVIITTDKVYQPRLGKQLPFNETDTLGGNDPYSASKACAELIIESYRNSFFNPKTYTKHLKAISSARAGNVIGGGDWSKDRLLPDIIKAIIRGTTIELRNPHAIRPWQHVLEAIGGYLHLGCQMATDSIKFSGPWNFGPYLTDHVTVEEVTKAVIDAWGNGTYIINSKNTALAENPELRLSIKKSIELLKWKPVLNFNQSIIKTVNWYKKAQEIEFSARDMMKVQIREYQELLNRQ